MASSTVSHEVNGFAIWFFSPISELIPVSYTHLEVDKRQDGNRTESANAKASLTARGTSRAGTKVGVSDPAE